MTVGFCSKNKKDKKEKNIGVKIEEKSENVVVMYTLIRDTKVYKSRVLTTLL